MPLLSSQSERVDALIHLLAETEVIADEELEKLSKIAGQAALAKMLRDGVNYGHASGAQDFYNQDESAFRGFLKSVNQDLEWQCNTVEFSFERYCKQGETPAPYFAMRIAILLRKAKEFEREKNFLAAWCKHFNFSGSGTYSALVVRAQKIGAITN
jgi:hypothetical protein